MINIQRVLRNDRLLKIFASLHREAFNELCDRFDFVCERTQFTLEPRQRAKGGGRKARLRRNDDSIQQTTGEVRKKQCLMLRLARIDEVHCNISSLGIRFERLRGDRSSQIRFYTLQSERICV